MADRITILLCTANLGNARPDQESWDNLVPDDGFCHDKLANSSYPMRDVCLVNGTSQEHDVFEEGKQFDLIVFGFQEATFDVIATEEDVLVANASEASPNVSCRVSSTTEISEDSGRGLKAKLKESKNIGKRVVKQTRSRLESLTASRDNMSASNLKSDSSKVLRALMLDRLPSYEPIVSYQRGEMRLEILAHRSQIQATVIHVAAQNTGRAGLANKGGIVAELLVNGTTRLSFLTAHLEAHEGRYKTRVTTLGDIFSGTKHKEYDCSLTAHYSFVMGDLNFRSEHPDHETMGDEEHKALIMDMVERKDWEALNEIDELERALENKDCCVGYETPRCLFPPTFKVERQPGYQYIEKRRPSYTDRVLWKANHSLQKGIEPFLYEPVDSFTSSDHKPVRAAVAVKLNPSFKLRPRMIKTPSARRINRKSQHDTTVIGSKERCHLFVSNMSCSITTARGGSAGFDMAPNPYVTLVTNPPEALRYPSKRKFGRVRQKLVNSVASLSFVRATKRTKQGFPRSSIRHHKNNAEFESEEIAAEIFTHAPSGAAHDLSGLQLFLTVMDRRRNAPDDNVLGTVVVNLIDMIEKCRHGETVQDKEDPNLNSKSFTLAAKRRQSVLNLFGRSSSAVDLVEASNNSEADDRIPIEVLDIDQSLLKNGVVTGRLRCKLEVWWVNSYLGGSMLFEPRKSFSAARASQLHGRKQS